MEFNVNSLLKVARVVAPIPTAIIDAVTGPDAPAAAPPPPPPPQEPKLPANAVLPAPNADVGAARAKANAIWNKPGETLAGENRQIQGRGIDITSPGARAELARFDAEADALDRAGKPEEAKALRDEVAKVRKDIEKADAASLTEAFANRRLEKDKLATMSPAEQAQYAKLTAFFENDHQARLAVQMLLLEGKLTAAPKNKDGQDLLGALTKLSETRCEAPLTPGQLLGESVREIANPASIKQGTRNTCSAAALQVMMATQRPAEYVRLMTGLATEGNPGVAMANGDTLKRVPGTEKDGDFQRTGTQELWQAALMQYEADKIKPGAVYDPKTDSIKWDANLTTNHGIIGRGMEAGLEAVTGDAHALVDMPSTLSNLTRNVAEMKQNDPGAKVQATLGTRYDAAGDPQGSERVDITRIEGGFVYYKGADGKTGMVAEEEFRQRLQKVETEASTGRKGSWERETVTNAMHGNVVAAVAAGGRPIVMLRQGEWDPTTGTVQAGNVFEGNPEANHYVTVTKIENGRVFFLNSQGSEESMAEAAFKNRLANATTRA